MYMYVADLSEEELVEGASVLGGGATCRHRRGDHALNIKNYVCVIYTMLQCDLPPLRPYWGEAPSKDSKSRAV